MKNIIRSKIQTNWLLWNMEEFTSHSVKHIALYLMAIELLRIQIWRKVDAFTKSGAQLGAIKRYNCHPSVQTEVLFSKA